jgi:MoaA/NifB/PqqE/SkfB family radical SAM enzyme
MLISWNTTKKCNLFCKHCFRDSGPAAASENELTTEEAKRLMEQICQGLFLIGIRFQVSFKESGQ